MALGADLERAATQLVSPDVSGIDPSTSPSVDAMLTRELTTGVDHTHKFDI